MGPTRKKLFTCVLLVRINKSGVRIGVVEAVCHPDWSFGATSVQSLLLSGDVLL